ncbi:MAG: ParB/RepB/Spo0J family partition protein, partial [Candidatus Bathyarchaeia archaeon]
LELPTELIYWKDPIRKDIRREDVDDMATSIMCHGQIQPIVVTGPDEEGKYEGVCGRLRYEAMKRFPGRPILARVHQFKSAREKREWQLAENLHRRGLTTLQRAEAYLELYESMREEFGGVHDKHIVSTIAKRQEELTGEKAPAERSIRKYIQVSKDLPEEVKKTVIDDRFGIAHAEQLLRLKGMPEKQLDLAEEFAKEPMTVQKLKKRVDEILNPPEPKPSPIDTGLKFECPICGETYMIIHVDEGKHRFESVTVMESGFEGVVKRVKGVLEK